MKAREVKTVADARQIVTERELEYVKVAVTDTDGVLRGKYMQRDKFLSALEGGFGFCDVVLGWDSNDQLYDNVSLTGWHTGYGMLLFALFQKVAGNCRWKIIRSCFLGSLFRPQMKFAREVFFSGCLSKEDRWASVQRQPVSSSFSYLRKRPTVSERKTTAI